MDEISQDEREKIREEERRNIMEEMKREKHASYRGHDSCKSLGDELSDYYRGHHRSYTKHHSQIKEEKRIEGLKRLTLASHISMEKIMLMPT